MKSFTSIYGQSIYDVCLQTYGTLDHLFKLMQDNGINGLNEPSYARKEFIWDDALVQDQRQNAAFSASGQLYSTDVSNSGSVFYVINQGGTIIMPEGEKVDVPEPTNPPKTYFQMVYSTSFTSSANGTTVITPLTITGDSMAGFDIVQIENEIKPLKASQFVWNKDLGVLTLLGGVTCDMDQTLFILYSKVVSL